MINFLPNIKYPPMRPRSARAFFCAGRSPKSRAYFAWYWAARWCAALAKMKRKKCRLGVWIKANPRLLRGRVNYFGCGYSAGWLLVRGCCCWGAQSLTSDPNISKSDPNKLNDARERDCIKMPAATAERAFLNYWKVPKAEVKRCEGERYRVRK